jgi:hypothetical protein
VGGCDLILEKQDFVTGELKIMQKILTKELRFPERKILFAPLGASNFGGPRALGAPRPGLVGLVGNPPLASLLTIKDKDIQDVFD